MEESRQDGQVMQIKLKDTSKWENVPIMAVSV